METFDPENATIEELRRAMESGALTARRIVEVYLERIDRIDRHGPALHSIIETNPDAERIAQALDRERAERGPRGSLHGIPVLLKDNIDTADEMMTTAGSLALAGVRRANDATVASKLREAGAILLGKANMSEWANFRSTHSSSGWSARGGQALNPYALDRTPCGSSSGSASAVAAGLTPVSLGTETNGSILCPASINGVVGIKPTVGLTSRAGVIPVAHSQDTVGPFGRTVADAADVLAVIAGPDPCDPATQDSSRYIPAVFTRELDLDGLQGARIGVARETYFGYSEKTDKVVEEAIEVMRELGAVIVDPANIPSAERMRQEATAELDVLLYEFKSDLNRYLHALGPDAPVHALQDIIDFNDRYAEMEMPHFGQELMHKAQEKGNLADERYQEALATVRRLSREEGIDAVMDEMELDALLMPTTSPAWKIDHVLGDHHLGGSSGPGAMAGYPSISVPAGYTFGLPVGITFTGRAWSEPTLIRLAYAFEQAAHVWQPPTYRLES